MKHQPRKTQAEWQSLIEQQRTSGQTITEFCQTHELSVTSFYNWKSKLSKSAPNFKSVTIASSKAAGKIRCLLPNGLKLEWDEAVSPSSIVSLIEQLS